MYVWYSAIKSEIGVSVDVSILALNVPISDLFTSTNEKRNSFHCNVLVIGYSIL